MRKKAQKSSHEGIRRNRQEGRNILEFSRLFNECLQNDALTNKRNLTDTELGKIFRVDNSTIYNWRNARNAPKDPILVLEIADFFKVTVEKCNQLLVVAGCKNAIKNLSPEMRSSMAGQETAITSSFEFEMSTTVQEPGENNVIPYPNIVEQPNAVLTAFSKTVELNPDSALATFAALPVDHIPPIRSLPTGSYIPFSHNPFFVGRESELKTLAVMFKEGGVATIGQIAAVTGLGGIGKTQLAVSFAHHYGHYFSGGVYWLNFSEPDNIPAEIVRCSITMPDLPPNFSTFGFKTQVHVVESLWQSSLPRLLVFDNCENQALLAQWRPPTGGSRVLVTGRRASWEGVLGVSVLALEMFSRSQSIELLRKFRPDLPANDSSLNQIADELGDLPLALHLAGSFLARYRHSTKPAEYLAQLRQPDILNHRSFQISDHNPQADMLSPTKHVQHVRRTFELSYYQLSSNDPVDKIALSLLSNGTCFAPGEIIPRALLLKTVEDEYEVADWQMEDGLRRLIDLGLFGEATEGGLRLHRLVTSFIQQANAEFIPIAQTSVESVLLEEVRKINNSGLLKALFPWQGHLRHVTDNALQRSHERSAALCTELGYYLNVISDYANAKFYYEQALASSEAIFGLEHSDTARSYDNLGILLLNHGDLAEAKPYLEKALAIRETVLAVAHPDIASSFSNLGMLLLNHGDLAEAKLYLEKALAVHSMVLGMEDASTATSLHNVGLLFMKSGDLIEAKFYLEKALTIYEAVFGLEHPITARSYENLGLLLLDNGDLAEAKQHLEQALAIYEKVLDTENPNVIRCYINLGRLLYTSLDLSEVKPYYERALTLFENSIDEIEIMQSLLAQTGDDWE